MGRSQLLSSEFDGDGMSTAEGYHENHHIKSVKSLKKPQENNTQSPLTTGMGDQIARQIADLYRFINICNCVCHFFSAAIRWVFSLSYNMRL